MNLKDYSKPQIKGYVTATEKLNRANFGERFRSHIHKNPKKTVVIMLVFATLNFVLMVYVVNSRPAAPLIPKDIGKTTTTVNSRHSNAAASFSFSNYMKISKLKDSLDYLMKLPSLTKTDSLLFIRICDEYSKLDPTFFRQVKQAIDKKEKNSNHEKNNSH